MRINVEAAESPLRTRLLIPIKSIRTTIQSRHALKVRSPDVVDVA
jgi:hypothetical protein